MGFGANLQGKSSHEALIKQLDAELHLLDTIKKCITQRIKCDREYAVGLETVLSVAHKYTAESSTPVFGTWDCIVKETEQLIHLVQENTDKMCASTLERVVHLISEAKANRRIYLDEKQRMEVEFAKLQEDVQRFKGEYEKTLEKLHVSRARYEDLFNRGKAGGKFDDARLKYHRQATRLHRIHNDYVLAIRNVNIHQQHFLGTNLPHLLDFQQERLESAVAQCKDVLKSYTELTDSSAEKFATCHKAMRTTVSKLNPKLEYSDFIKENKSECLDYADFEFERNLLTDYKGTLKPNEIAMDDLTIEALQSSRGSYEDTLAGFRLRLENKQKELSQTQADLKAKGSLANMDDNLKNSYYSLKRSEAILQKDITELEGNVKKYEQLYDLVNRPLTQLGGDDPPPGIELKEMGTYDNTDKDKSDTASNSSHNNPISPSFKLGSIMRNMANPFRKGTNVPPPAPPNRLEIDASQQEETQNNHTQKDETPSTSKRKTTASDSYQHCEITGQGSGEPQVLLESGRPLDQEEWFHGVLPREEVVRLLKNDGDYLVRESKSRKTGETQYVLSVMWDGHKHFIIQGSEGSWRFEGQSYPTIQLLIHHQLMSGTPVTNRSKAILKQPIMKEEWELRNDDIQLGQKIGNGNFGEVYRGTYKNQEVAVKTCRETLSDDAKKKFLQEGRILKQYNHSNIVKFIGIATQRNPVMIVMEFVPGGALLTFLRKQGQSQTIKQLIKMCEDAGNGMAYLEDKGCIHRDLAARNCLVGKNNMVKISDFGMSREEEEYTVSDGLKQIPIKWTAPEALNYGRYTSMCDVWSFGILMYEVFSCGATPYPGLSNNQARDKIDAGYRMPAPEGTPQLVYDLMLRCWDKEPDQRPHFKEIHRELQRIRISL